MLINGPRFIDQVRGVQEDTDTLQPIHINFQTCWDTVWGNCPCELGTLQNCWDLHLELYHTEKWDQFRHQRLSFKDV